MKKKIEEWLEMEMIINKNGIGKLKVTILDRLCELISVNGGSTNVTRWNIIQAGGLYGRMGLTLDEAMELINLNAFMNGVLYVDDGRDKDLLISLIQNRIDIVRKTGFDPKAGLIEAQGAIKIYTEDEMQHLAKGFKQVSRNFRIR